MSKTKKEALLKQIDQSKDITDQEKEWINDKYLPYLKRTGGQSPGTHANYLQAIRKLLEEHREDITEIQNLEEKSLQSLNESIADNIQASRYRETQGETSKRRKRHLWTTWKKALETQGVDTSAHQGYMPKVKFTSNGKVTRQADTRPEDLPTPSQMKKFARTLGEVSGESVKLRNQALALVLWDKGPRIGEALNLKIGDVTVVNDRVKLDITGNKRSRDRTVEVFQGRKLLKDYIEQHPGKEDSEAYLFARLKHQDLYTALSKKPLRRKFHQAKAQASLDFKTEGEPFHIFRKAMITSHIVNEWATWEQITTWHGKKDDGTKPDYLKMATSDVDASVAQKMGVSSDRDRENDNRMLGAPLLPVKCSECGKQNRCIHDNCRYCGHELPESKMPKGERNDPKTEVKEFATQAGGLTQEQLENLIENKIRQQQEQAQE